LLRLFERLVWIFGALAVGAVILAALLLRPSGITLTEITVRRVEKEEQHAWLMRTFGAPQTTAAGADDGAASTSSGYSYEQGRAVFDKYRHWVLEQYREDDIARRMFDDRKLLEKYRSWHDLIQAVQGTAAEAVYDQQGRLIAVRITSLPANSPLRTLVGLKEGDEIVSVCGEMPQSEEEAMGLYDRLRYSDFFYVELMRGGRRKAFTYQFGR